MKGVTVYINGTDIAEMGIIFEEKSLTSLMTPPPNKPYVQNKSYLDDGKVTVTSYCKVDERNVQLVFGVQAGDTVQFLQRYRNFCSILRSGAVDITVSARSAGKEVYKVTYYLDYLSCSQFMEFNGRLAKFVLKLNEPNPANQKVEI